MPSSRSDVSIPESEFPSLELTLPSSEPTIDDRILALDEVFRDFAKGLMLGFLRVQIKHAQWNYT